VLFVCDRARTGRPGTTLAPSPYLALLSTPALDEYPEPPMPHAFPAHPYHAPYHAHLPTEEPGQPETPQRKPPPVPDSDVPPPPPLGDPPSDAPPERAMD
jgi:hypothetical protein